MRKMPTEDILGLAIRTFFGLEEDKVVLNSMERKRDVIGLEHEIDFTGNENLEIFVNWTVVWRDVFQQELTKLYPKAKLNIHNIKGKGFEDSNESETTSAPKVEPQTTEGNQP